MQVFMTTRRADFVSYTQQSIRRALSGNLPRGLIGITFARHDKKLFLRFLFSGPPDAEQFDSATTVSTEVIADFPPDWDLEDEYLGVEPFKEINNYSLGNWAYLVNTQ
jgi:hypothetical protein